MFTNLFKKRIHPLMFEFVQITVRLTISKGEYSDGQGIEKARPLALQGWLVDEDENNFYFSDDMEDVSFVVNKKDYVYMERVQETDKYDEMLDGFKGNVSN